MFTAKNKEEEVFLFFFLTLMLATSETIVVVILERNSIVTQLRIFLDITGQLHLVCDGMAAGWQKKKMLFFNTFWEHFPQFHQNKNQRQVLKLVLNRSDSTLPLLEVF